MSSTKKTKRKKVKETKIGYLCGVDWQHELVRDNANHVELFGSSLALSRKKPCVEECGIVKVKVTIEKWIIPQDFSKVSKK